MTHETKKLIAKNIKLGKNADETFEAVYSCNMSPFMATSMREQFNKEYVDIYDLING